MNEVELGTRAFVELLGAAVVIAIVADRIRLPAAVALVAFGALVSAFVPIKLPFELGSALLFVFLPPLIFEAAWNMHAGALRRMTLGILVMAIPGVVFTAALLTLGLVLSGALPVIPAFAFGTIVAATDPVGVVAIFRRLTVPVDLSTLIEGESIANDGVAIALYGVALAVAAPGHGLDVMTASRDAALGIVGGSAIGIVCAGIVGLAIRGARDRAAEVTATVVLAYVAYGLASSLNWSGVFATAAAGITLRALGRYFLTAQEPYEVDAFWEVVAFIANALVFLATGLVLHVWRIFDEPILVLVAVAAVFIARAVLAFGVLPLVGVGASRPGWRSAAFFSGMRGALSLTLALGLPAGFPDRAQVIDATIAVVLVTLVFQGAAIEAVLRRLPLAEAPAWVAHEGSGIGGPSPSS